MVLSGEVKCAAAPTVPAMRAELGIETAMPQWQQHGRGQRRPSCRQSATAAVLCILKLRQRGVHERLGNAVHVHLQHVCACTSLRLSVVRKHIVISKFLWHAKVSACSSCMLACTCVSFYGCGPVVGVARESLFLGSHFSTNLMTSRGKLFVNKVYAQD